MANLPADRRMTSTICVLFNMVLCAAAWGVPRPKRECREHATEGPRPIDPPGDVYARVGETVTLNCEGYFGCEDDTSSRLVDWMGQVDVPGYGPQPIGDLTEDPRYTVTKFTKADDTVLGAELVIRNLRESDFNKNLHCLMASAQVKNPSQHFIVRILQR